MTIRWGVLGCGDVVEKRVAGAIQNDPESELVAVSRRDEVKLAKFCKRFGVERAFCRDGDLIVENDLDAIYIATPNHLHCPETLACLAAGKHVLVEKPMGFSVAECREMVVAARSQGLRLGVAYYRRFYPVIERMREILDSGELGKLISIACVTSTPFAIDPGEDGYWRVDPAQSGGGALMDIGSHRLNLFLHLGGAITEVRALCDTVAASYASEDCASLVLRFENGAHGMLQCLFGTPGELDSLTVAGTKGNLVVDPLNHGELRITIGAERRVEMLAPHANFSSPLIADFVAAIRDEREPRVSGEEGLMTNAVMERAYQEAKG